MDVDSSVVDNLQRQLDEIEALRSVYSDDGCVVLDEDVAQVAAALAALQQQQHRQLGGLGALSHLPSVSGLIRLPGAVLAGAPVALRFQLPWDYPASAAARVTVECSAPRPLHERLGAALAQAAQEALGSEGLLLVLGRLQEEVEAQAAGGAAEGQLERPQAPREQGACSLHLAQPDGGPRHAGDSGPPEAAAAASAAPSDGGGCGECLLRAVVWFHHIKSTTKRKLLVGWARELSVGGFSKPGFPGVVVAEGPAGATREFLARVRSLSWQAMQVRGEEVAPCAACGGGVGDTPRRGLPSRFEELAESGMSDLGQHCRAAGLETLFLTALKLSRGSPASTCTR